MSNLINERFGKKRFLNILWVISPFLGFLLGDQFGQSLIRTFKSILGNNLTPKQLDAYFRLYYYSNIFGVFSAILFWTFVTCLIIGLGKKVEFKNNQCEEVNNKKF